MIIQSSLVKDFEKLSLIYSPANLINQKGSYWERFKESKIENELHEKKEHFREEINTFISYELGLEERLTFSELNRILSFLIADTKKVKEIKRSIDMPKKEQDSKNKKKSPREQSVDIEKPQTLSEVKPDMDITLYYLLRYGGISADLLNEISEEHRYIDFLFTNQRLLKSGFFASQRYRRVNRIIQENDLTLHRSVLDSVYLLVAFNAPLKIINHLFEEGYRNIRKVAELNSYEFNELVDAKTDTSYNRVAEAITEYTAWIRQNEAIVMEIVILDYLQHTEEELLTNLLNHVRQYFEYKSLPFDSVIFHEVVQEMQEIKLIDRKSDESVGLYQLDLKDFLTANFEDDDVFKRYLAGENYREIAKDRGVERQRIQQIYSQLIKLLPLLKEDIKYGELFTRYDFSEENFLTIFGESVEVYEYLNYQYKKGEENVIYYLLNNDYSESFVKEFAKSQNSIINHENELEPINKLNLVNQYMYEHRHQSFTIDELIEEINEVFAEYTNEGIEPYEDMDNTRALKRIIDDSLKIISSNDGSFRYYNLEGLDQEDFSLLKEAFDLPEGIYHAEKIYEKNLVIMQELNLLNGNELLDLYNKLNVDFPIVEKIVRRTEVQIGNKEKEKFIEEVLIEFNGECLTDVQWYLFDEYGLQEDSLRTYVLDRLRHFIVDGKIKIDQPETEIEDIAEYINKRLDKDVYSLRELNNETSEEFDEIISINNFMLKNTDYKVHDRFIIRKDYRTPIEAIQGWIKKDSFFNLSEAQLNTELSKSTYFYNATNELLGNFEIFRFNEDLYINKDRLEEAGIYQEEINDFIESVEQHFFVSGKKYMTIKSLFSGGFTHSLIDKGFENIFFAEILRNSSKLETIYTRPRIFYGKENGSKHRSDFINHLVQTHHSIDYQDLINILFDVYGLSYDQSSINYILTDTEAFYSNETQKYYKNKDQYRMEVYGK